MVNTRKTKEGARKMKPTSCEHREVIRKTVCGKDCADIYCEICKRMVCIHKIIEQNNIRIKEELKRKVNKASAGKLDIEVNLMLNSIDEVCGKVRKNET